MMMTYLRVALGVVVLVGLTTAPVHAGIWNGVEVTPRVNLQAVYDDNVTFAHVNPVSDSRKDLALGLNLDREGKDYNFNIDGLITRQMFTHNSSFDNTIENFDANYSLELSKYDQFAVRDLFSHSAEPGSFADAFGRNGGRYSTYHNLFNTGYHHDMNESSFWDVRYINDLTDFSRSDIHDSVLNGLGADVGYMFNAKVTMKMNYNASIRKFYPGKSATENELSTLLRYSFSKQLYVDAQAGLNLIHAYDGKDFSKPMYRMSLINDVNATTRTSLTMLDKRCTTIPYAQDLWDEWRVMADISKDLTNTLRGVVTAFYGEGTYVAQDASSKFTGADIGVVYELTRRAEMNLHYSYAQDDASSAGAGYIKNSVSIGVNVKF
jgi:hypothetical protein